MKKFVLPILAVALLGLSTAQAQPVEVPDTGSSSLLLGSAVVGLGFLRHYFRK
jgi:hypothetical protein